MKILYDYQAFVRQKYGGVSRYFYELVTRICSEPDIDVMMWMGRHINKYKIEDFKENLFYFYGKRVYPYPRTKILSAWAHKPFFRRFYNKADLDILHQTFYCDYGKKKNTKLVITLHDFTPEKYTKHFSRLNNAIKVKRKTIEQSDGLICISNNTKKDLLELFDVPESKIRVIYHGNSLLIKPDDKPLFPDPYVLFVGGRYAYKNFSILVDAISSSVSFKDIKILCFGGGGFSRDEKTYIKAKKMVERISHIEGDDFMLANAYKYASAFVYPSLYEGFGIPLLEAMHYGCPILASETSCFPEIAGDAALFFNPLLTEDFAFKLERLLTDTLLREKLVENGFKREKLFSWDKCAKETLGFYKSLV